MSTLLLQDHICENILTRSRVSTSNIESDALIFNVKRDFPVINRLQELSLFGSAFAPVIDLLPQQHMGSTQGSKVMLFSPVSDAALNYF